MITLKTKLLYNPSEILIKKNIRRGLDIFIAVVGSTIAASTIAHFSSQSLLIGGLCGIIATAWYALNFLSAECLMHGATCNDYNTIKFHFMNKNVLHALGESEFTDGRHSEYFNHWRFKNIKLSYRNDVAQVVAPIMHLRLLISSLREQGLEFEDDPESSICLSK